MGLKFNIDREKVSDEEIKKNMDFDGLVRQFKKQSLKQARGDESWWRNKKITYSAVIAGVTVLCTVTLLSLKNSNHNSNEKQNAANEIKSTPPPSSPHKKAQQRNFISPPSKKLAPKYASYRINASTGGTIRHAATRIQVPRAAFVDAKGAEIRGDVTIEYCEFHDAADIIASGIPMQYDSAGIHRDFESAGMFDIRGMQNGAPVFMKKDRPVTVELASANAADRFNQYFLDTVQKRWLYIKKDEIRALPPQPAATATEQTPLEQKLASLDQKIVRIPLDAMNDRRETQAKFEALPVPVKPHKPSAPTGRPTFVLDAQTADFPELSAFDNVVFEVGTENSNYRKNMHDITWTDVKISEGPVKGKNYMLTLTHYAHVEKLVVYPVLTGKDLKKAEAIFATKLQEYEKLADKRAAEEKRIIAEMEARQSAYMKELERAQQEYKRALAEQQEQLRQQRETAPRTMTVRRIFQVSSFGTYNSDCARAQGNSVLAAKFYTNDGKVSINPVTVYLVDKTDNAVVIAGPVLRYKRGNINNICVFNEQGAYFCDETEFKRVLKEKDVRINMTRLPDTEDTGELKKALGL